MKPLASRLCALLETTYDNYNTILPKIKKALHEADIVGDQRVETFERVLGEELPLTTGRRAYRTAICIALGEPNGYCREFRPPQPQAKKTK